MNNLTIRPEEHRDYKSIISLILRSFREGTDYSDGTDIIALVEEIRDSQYYIPGLSFVAELDGQIVGHFENAGYKLGAWRGIRWLVKQIGSSDGEPQTPLKLSEVIGENLRSGIL